MIIIQLSKSLALNTNYNISTALHKFKSLLNLQVFNIKDNNESNLGNSIAKEKVFSESRAVKILRIWYPSQLSYSSIPTTSSEKETWPEPQHVSNYLNRITFANNITLQDKQNYLVRVLFSVLLLCSSVNLTNKIQKIS